MKRRRWFGEVALVAAVVVAAVVVYGLLLMVFRLGSAGAESHSQKFVPVYEYGDCIAVAPNDGGPGGWAVLMLNRDEAGQVPNGDVHVMVHVYDLNEFVSAQC